MTNHVRGELRMIHFVMHLPNAEAAKLQVGVRGGQLHFEYFFNNTSLINQIDFLKNPDHKSVV